MTAFPINYSNTLDQQFLEAVKETITENLDNSGFNVESLCASQNMSRSSFYNKLKSIDRPSSGRLYPPDPAETGSAITIRGSIIYPKYQI